MSWQAVSRSSQKPYSWVPLWKDTELSLFYKRHNTNFWMRGMPTSNNLATTPKIEPDTEVKNLNNGVYTTAEGRPLNRFNHT